MLELELESGLELGLESGCIQYIKLLIQYIKLWIQYIKPLIQYTINWVTLDIVDDHGMKYAWISKWIQHKSETII